jgi:hypothetical protein
MDSTSCLISGSYNSGGFPGNEWLLFRKFKKNKFLKDQSTFGELIPCDRAQNLEHFLLLRHYLKI